MSFQRAAAVACVRALACTLVAFVHGLWAQEASLWVAVGHDGRCVTSRDGQIWEDQPALKSADQKSTALFDIAYGGGRFVAVGGGDGHGRILSSVDGARWQAVPGIGGPISTIAFGNDRFVACGREGLMNSKDGQVFQQGRPLEWHGKVHPRRSACGDTEAGFRFVIIGQIEREGVAQPAFWRGATGEGDRWAHTALDTAPVNDVAYGGGIFVVVGPDGLIESSHDGQTWVRRASTPGEDLSRVVWTGNRFLVSSLNTAWSSPDGFEWKREAGELPCKVIWAREKRLGIGLSLIGELCTSRDLVHWKKTRLPDGPPFFAVAGRE